jgi:hypothetical protein
MRRHRKPLGLFGFSTEGGGDLFATNGTNEDNAYKKLSNTVVF